MSENKCSVCGSKRIKFETPCPLHAAAPQLLEALEQAMLWLDNNQDHESVTVNDFVDGSGFSALASAAIRAAKGESNG